MSAIDEHLEKTLAAIESRGERRAMRPFALEAHGRLTGSERTLLDFSSNDYLGLARHPALAERACEWTRLHGSGSGASRLVTGTSTLHQLVESRIAAFKKTEAALLFSSGWQANAAIIPALVRALPGVSLFTDRLVHASIHHGCAAAGARQIRYRHNDLDHLDALLAAKAGGKPCLIITESVFSMDGDRVDLTRLTAIARKHGAFLYLDEAHATGVLGPGGAGLSAETPGSVDLVMGTFSKAFGSFGAYVAGSHMLCDYLVNACSGFIFTTALPPAVLGAIDAALDIVPKMDRERLRLTEMGRQVRKALEAAGFAVGASTTQIIPAIVGGTADATMLSRRLEEAGILAAAIRPPTVPRGTSRVRLALRASHAQADIERLLDVIAQPGGSVR